ncbi:MAG: hypothetical protein Q7J56_02115 [Deltaproteobacteria bacterium]|nr:hypothetical protein [Deltaproteobacteria bacterium]
MDSFEGGCEGVADFLDDNAEVGKLVGFFEAFISGPEDVEAGFVLVEAVSIRNNICAASRRSRRLLIVPAFI